MRKLTKAQFIEKARTVHGDKYLYDKVDYRGIHVKVCITCPKHGDFWQVPSSHLCGNSCPRCRGPQKKTRDEFLTESRRVHGDRYIYDKVVYADARTRVEIVCPTHGSFWQRPLNHMKGRGCPACGHLMASKKQATTTESFTEKALAVHGDRYTVIDDSGAAHKCSYIYDKVDYRNAIHKVCIVCPVHGEFWQAPFNHLNGQGCPKCNRSKLEITTESILESLGVKYIYLYHDRWLGLQSLDFYLPQHHIGIECQGIQHYRPVEFFGGQEGFEECKKRDALKAQKCGVVGVSLVYIRYDQDAQSIEQAIRSAISSGAKADADPSYSL